MALTKATGSDGSLTFITGYNACFDSWSIVIGQRINNITCFGATYEGNIGGLKFGRFTATGTPIYDAASTSPIASNTLNKSSANTTFQVATGCTIVIPVIVAELALSSDVNGAARVAYSGPTDGAPTVVWDEA